MAKKRRKKSSKCPEPFNFLIDIAAGATMNAIANKKKNTIIKKEVFRILIKHLQ